MTVLAASSATPLGVGSVQSGSAILLRVGLSMQLPFFAFALLPSVNFLEDGELFLRLLEVGKCGLLAALFRILQERWTCIFFSGMFVPVSRWLSLQTSTRRG